MFWKQKLGLISCVNTMHFRTKHKRYSKNILKEKPECTSKNWHESERSA